MNLSCAEFCHLLTFSLFSFIPTASLILPPNKLKGKKANIQVEAELPVTGLFPLGFGGSVPKNTREFAKSCPKAIPNISNIKQ